MSGTWTQKDGEWMLLVPRIEAEEAGAKEGGRCEISAGVVDERIVLRRQNIPPLEELLAGMPQGMKYEEYDWGPPVGKEVW